MSSGITSAASYMSFSVGVIRVAPSTARILPIVLTRLDDEATSSRASAARVNPWIRSMTCWSYTLLACTRIPSVLEKPVSSSSLLMSATTWLPWSIHLIGSLSIRVFSSTSTPPTNSPTPMIASIGAILVGRLPSHTMKRSTHGSLSSVVVGMMYSRIPSADAGTTMPTITSITIPTASNTPKSRIIGTFEIWSAVKATTPTIVAVISGGATLASVSPIGCSA